MMKPHQQVPLLEGFRKASNFAHSRKYLPNQIASISLLM